jgi:hypothetical protein
MGRRVDGGSCYLGDPLLEAAVKPEVSAAALAAVLCSSPLCCAVLCCAVLCSAVLSCRRATVQLILTTCSFTGRVWASTADAKTHSMPRRAGCLDQLPLLGRAVRSSSCLRQQQETLSWCGPCHSTGIALSMSGRGILWLVLEAQGMFCNSTRRCVGQHGKHSSQHKLAPSEAGCAAVKWCTGGPVALG